MLTNLNVTTEQKEFVSNPYIAIALSKFERGLKTLAIYLDDKVIGFVAYRLKPLNNSYWIEELIIDKDYQKKGYGKIALKQLMKILKEKDNCYRAYGGYRPNNIASKKLCESLGFTETDIFTEDHIVIYKDL
jgi:diamine N-acetyltransferase